MGIAKVRGQNLDDFDDILDNENLAPFEDTNYASKAYAKDRLMLHLGFLYKTTKAIAKDDELIIGNNIRKTSIDELLAGAMKSHIGMIVESTTLDTEAKVIAVYGGETWIQHTGYVLRGGTSSDVTANDAQATGGSDDAVVVAHSHSVSVSGGNHAHSYTAPSTYQESWDNEAKVPQNQPSSTPATTGYSGNLSMSGTAAATGVDGTNANIPAYKSVYIWERTA